MNYRHRQAHSVRSCRMLPRTLSKDLAREIHMTEMRLWLNRIHATPAPLWASFFFGEEHDIDSLWVLAWLVVISTANPPETR